MTADTRVAGVRVGESAGGARSSVAESPARRRDGFRRMRFLHRASIYAMIIIAFVVFAFPIYWLVITSLMPEKDVFAFPPKLIPTAFDWQNYRDALSTFPFLSGLRNTLTIAFGVEVGLLISVPVAGYVFARMRFPLKRALFVILISTLMIPPYVTIIPQYLIFRDLGWIDTFLPPYRAVLFWSWSRLLYFYVPTVLPRYPARL